jgi:hypothetical protein
MDASHQIEQSYLKYENDLKSNLPNAKQTNIILKLAKDSYVMSLLLLKSKEPN